MKKMLFSVVTLLLLTALMVACSNNDNAENENDGAEDAEITLKLGHTLTSSSPFHQLAEKFKEEIEDRTDGKVSVSIFPSSQLGGELDMIKSARTGGIDMFIAANTSFETNIPEWGLLSIPFLFEDKAEANTVLQSEVGDKFLDMLSEQNLVGLGWLGAIERDLFGNKKIDLEDMDGYKVRVIESPGYVKSYEALGASPTPMAYDELYLSLQQGTVDGGETSPDQFVDDKFSEVSDYFYISKINYLPTALIMSQEILEGMDEDIQEKIQEAADAALEYEIGVYDEAYERGISEMTEAGVEVIEDLNFEKAKEKTEDVKQSIIDGVDDGQALFDEIENAK